MIVLDKMIVGGVRFVLGKLAQAVDAEMNDDSRLREELLASQMRLELGEISEEEFAAIEADLLGRLREIRERQMAEPHTDLRSGEFKVTGVEATIHGEDVRRR
jgi:Gas vesicle protein G